MYLKKFIFLAILIIMLAGCDENNQSKDESAGQMPSSELNSKPLEKENEQVKIKANEAGEAMIIMYHYLGPEEKSTVRTPDNFRKDLETLYRLGYRAINLSDYVTGNIEIEAGFSPVILTFDDGLESQFRIVDSSSKTIDPDCAVGILEEFNKKHPDFGMKATFFINAGVPFGQKELVKYKLNYILEKGMEIGNHTVSHANLSKAADGNKIIEEISGLAAFVSRYTNGYQVKLLSLPFGGKPKDEFKHLLISDPNKTYNNIAVVEVGWDPCKSPYSKDFNPYAIHRIWGSDLKENVGDFGLNSWILKMEEGKRTKFISDGDPEKITVPDDFKDKIDLKKIEGRNLVAY